MTRRRDAAPERRRTTGRRTASDPAHVDVIDRESDASFPASDAPGWTTVTGTGSPGRQGRTTRGKAAPLDLRIKRAYEPPSAEDGVRILVDRLWPRGLAKAEAAIDRWLRDLAPSTELRKWFGHDPARWDEFRRRYAHELRGQEEQLEEVRSLARQGRVTLLFGARDETHNQAVALREVLLK